jgi:predicted HicB family RNase H-like nuclease
MKQAIDFTKGERGKFYRKNATFKLPVYLDAEVERYLTQKAAHKGVELSDLVNQLLKKEIEIIEAVK